MKLVVTALKHNNLTLAIKAVANAQTELDAVQAILEKFVRLRQRTCPLISGKCLSWLTSNRVYMARRAFQFRYNQLILVYFARNTVLPQAQVNALVQSVLQKDNVPYNLENYI